MLRIAISIKEGKVSASTIARRLGERFDPRIEEGPHPEPVHLVPLEEEDVGHDPSDAADE